MTECVTVGVIGTGYIAKDRHIPFWKDLDNARLVAIADLDEKQLSQTKTKYEIPNAFTNAEEMVETLEMDVIDICTPPNTHASLGTICLELGCHVITEKPLALSYEEAEELVETANKTGQKLCTIHQILFSPPTRRAKQAISEGKIGEPQGMRIFISTPADKFLRDEESWIHQIEGGLLEETGPHAIYLSQPFIGQIADIHTVGRKVTDVSWADWDDFSLQLIGSDATSSIRIIHHSNYRAFEVDIWGSSGRIKTDLQTMHYHRFKRDSLKKHDLAISALRETASQTGSLVRTGFNTATGQIQLGHEVIFKRFINSILHDTESPVTADEALETVRVLETATNKLNK